MRNSALRPALVILVALVAAFLIFVRNQAPDENTDVNNSNEATSEQQPTEGAEPAAEQQPAEEQPHEHAEGEEHADQAAEEQPAEQVAPATTEEPSAPEQPAETPAPAQEGESQPEEQQAQTEGQPAAYTYTAQPGDSYAKIARKAVQTYGINKNVNLSQAQIVAAETYLTLKAGSPVLSVGQSVSISEADIQAAVERAQGLSEATLKRWESYAAGVDFNTDNVGEAR